MQVETGSTCLHQTELLNLVPSRLNTIIIGLGNKYALNRIRIILILVSSAVSDETKNQCNILDELNCSKY